MTLRTARSALAVAAFAAAACSSTPTLKLPEQPRGKVALELRGEWKGSPRAIGEEDLAALPALKVKGTDPVTGRSAEWEGPDLSVLVRHVTEARPGIDTVVVRTAAGEAVPVSLGKFMQYRPALATRADGAALEASRLAWPNGAQPGLLRDPRHRAWWAEKVTALELVRWSRAFGRNLTVPGGAPAEARRGAGLFVERCLNCHAMRGAGGTRGPELSAWGAGHDLGALSAKLGQHPGRLPDDLEQDFVVPLQAYLEAMPKAPKLEPLPPLDKDGRPPPPGTLPADEDGEGPRPGRPAGDAPGR